MKGALSAPLESKSSPLPKASAQQSNSEVWERPLNLQNHDASLHVIPQSNSGLQVPARGSVPIPECHLSNTYSFSER